MYNSFFFASALFLAIAASPSSARRQGLRDHPHDDGDNGEQQRLLIKNERGGSGAVVPRIVDGIQASSDNYKYFCAIIQKTFGFQSHTCGGSLIHPEWVLTAAHCVPGADMARVGAYTNGGWNNGGSTSQDRNIKRCIKHPKYNDDTLDNDLALCQLSSPVTESRLLEAMIDLKKSRTLDASVSANDRLTVMGLGTLSEDGGQPNFLQHVELEFVNRETCRWYYPFGQITDSMICAEDPNKSDGTNEDACFGDSGGPLVLEKEDGHVLLGVVSFGRGCGSNSPGVYARVGTDAVLDWIEERICRFSSERPLDCPAEVVTPTPPPASGCASDKGCSISNPNSFWGEGQCLWDYGFFGMGPRKCDETCGVC